MWDTSTAPEFAEGTIDFTTEVWFCGEHEVSVTIGTECAFCVHDELGPRGFDAWAARHARQ
jgi:hypothetical protein